MKSSMVKFSMRKVWFLVDQLMPEDYIQKTTFTSK